MERIAWVLVVLAWCTPCRAADATAGGARDPASGILRQLIIEDFDTPEHGEVDRYCEVPPICPADLPPRIGIELDPSPRPGASGGSLHFGYDLAPIEGGDAGLSIELGGLDASDYNYLAFWVKGDESEGYGSSLKIGFRRVDRDGREQVQEGAYVASGITDDWQLFVVPLDHIGGIRDWTQLQQLFLSVSTGSGGPGRGAYYIDDIMLLKANDSDSGDRSGLRPHRKTVWEEALGGPQAAKPFIKARLRGWPRRPLAGKGDPAETDQEFAWRLARDTWRGLAELTDRYNGLPIDHLRLSKDSLEPQRARIGDYTNITNIGLYLASVVAARDLGLISDREAEDRLRTVLDTLQHLETYEGFFYNYYDTTSLERTSNLLSFVDSAWLAAGLMVVRQAFPDLYDQATQLLDRQTFAFFYDPVVGQMFHGFYVNPVSPSTYHYGVLYSESRLGSMIAIGKGDVPAEHWFKMVRTFPPESTWQTQAPQGQVLQKVDGEKVVGGYYEWDGLKYVPSWGGSMFEALMPTLFLDEKSYAPSSLGRNDEVHAIVQRRYALEVLGYPVWGMSSSTSPIASDYFEYGVKVLGSNGYDAGVVTPHASALALSVTPQEALRNLRRLAELYDIYGDYGFYDAVDPVSGAVSYDYLLLDQAMTFLALANYLGDQCVQKRFAVDPIAVEMLPVIREENFFAAPEPQRVAIAAGTAVAFVSGDSALRCSATDSSRHDLIGSLRHGF